MFIALALPWLWAANNGMIYKEESARKTLVHTLRVSRFWKTSQDAPATTKKFTVPEFPVVRTNSNADGDK